MEVKNEKIINNENQLTTVLYYFPCTIDNDVESFRLGKLEFAKMQSRKRNLIRNDVRNFIDKTLIYQLDLKNINTTLFFEKENKADISLIKLNTIYLCIFDKSNAFLIFGCGIDSFDAIPGALIDVCIKNHIDFMTNYYKNVSIKNEDGSIEISSKLHLKLEENDIKFFSNVDPYALNNQLGIKFDFNALNARFFMNTTILNDYDRNLYLEHCINITNNTLYVDLEKKVFITKYYASKSSDFGNVIVYKYDVKKNTDEFNELNSKAMNMLYTEYFYDYLIALNYRIRIEKMLHRIGELKYNTSDSVECRKVISYLNDYRRISSECYFANVSAFDTINSWYHNVLNGFDVDIMNEELEMKFRNSIDHLKNRLREAEANETIKINIFNSVKSYIADLSLFVIAVFQVILCFSSKTYIKWIGLGICGLIATVSIIIRVVIWRKKHQAKSKYTYDLEE